jgi:hypothetical protein
MNISTFILVYLILAAWRLSNLLANEDGPFHVFQQVRRHIGVAEARSRRKGGLLSAFHLYEGVNCEYCNSIWFGGALTVGYLILGDVLLWIVLPLVISTGVILVKHTINLFGSVDARFDQQNQAHLAEQEAVKTRKPSSFTSAIRERQNGKGG